jgi:DNA-directed RNA polymerase subunit RPC12/RpoP
VKNQRKEKHHKRTEGFIDLASTMQAARSANAVYLCPECSTDLILDSSFKIKNSFAGSLGYFCGICNQTFDSSLVNLRKKPKAVNSTILSNPIAVFFSYVQEDKGIIDPDYDEYSKYDPEPNADQFLINSPATIKDSRIELTDNAGHNRTIVRRS